MVLVCFEILILSLIIIEYSFKKIITPFILLAGIYIFSIPIVNIVGINLGFLPVLDKTIVFFAFFLCVFYLPSIFLFIPNSNLDNNISGITKKLKINENIIWYIFLFSLICYIYNLIQVIRIYGVEGTKSHAFGIFAHIGFLSRCLFPIILYYFIETKKIKYLLGVLINIVGFIMFKGKYHLYITFGAFIFLMLYLKKVKINKIVKYAVFIFFISILLFVSVYTIMPNIISGDLKYSQMKLGIKVSTRHFFHYFLCPFITSNEYFDNSAYNGIINGLRVNFNGFDVLLEQFTGSKDFYGPEIKMWPIVEETGLSANVGGIFSESVLNLGFVGAIIYVFFVSIVVYIFYYLLLYRGKFLITTILLCGMTMMSFFCNYFSLMPNLECFVYSLILDSFIFEKDIKKLCFCLLESK